MSLSFICLYKKYGYSNYKYLKNKILDNKYGYKIYENFKNKLFPKNKISDSEFNDIVNTIVDNNVNAKTIDDDVSDTNNYVKVISNMIINTNYNHNINNKNVTYLLMKYCQVIPSLL